MLIVEKIVKEEHLEGFDTLEVRMRGTETEFSKVLDFITVRSQNLSVKGVSDCAFIYKDDKNYKVIYSMPATILFVGNKKFVSKAHLEDFDKEKGLLMCLAKANGISHLKLKKMIKEAEDQQEKKEKEII